jgi:molybdopterin synthase sulfur carrier subunit
VRERVGVASESVELPKGVATVEALLDWLRGRGAGHAAALREPTAVRVAVNQEYAALDAPVQDGDEVALFPPVTGG